MKPMKMQRAVFVVAATAGLSLFGAGTARAAASGPYLFYFDKSAPNQCIAKIRDMNAETDELLQVTKHCPSAMIWDFDGGRRFYVADGHVYSRPIRNSAATPTDLGSLPTGEEDIQDIWLDEGDNLRAAYFAAIDPKKVTATPKSVGEGDVSTYNFEGKQYVADKLVNWGVPWMAILVELRGGTWQRMEVAPTKWEAGDTNGLSALTTPKKVKTKTLSLKEMLAASLCAGSRLDCASELPAVKALVGKNVTQYGTLKLDEQHMMGFGVKFGDTAHASPPVFIGDKGLKKAKKLKDVTAEQLSIAAAGDFVLVADEYTNEHARVFRKTGELVWSQAKTASAIWYPGAPLRSPSKAAPTSK